VIVLVIVIIIVNFVVIAGVTMKLQHFFVNFQKVSMKFQNLFLNRKIAWNEN